MSAVAYSEDSLMEDVNLHFNGREGTPPEYGSTEYFFLLACTIDAPELWAQFDNIEESEMKAIVHSLISLGWGFEFVTLH